MISAKTLFSMAVAACMVSASGLSLAEDGVARISDRGRAGTMVKTPIQQTSYFSLQSCAPEGGCSEEAGCGADEAGAGEGCNSDAGEGCNSHGAAGLGGHGLFGNGSHGLFGNSGHGGDGHSAGLFGGLSGSRGGRAGTNGGHAGSRHGGAGANHGGFGHAAGGGHAGNGIMKGLYPGQAHHGRIYQPQDSKKWIAGFDANGRRMMFCNGCHCNPCQCSSAHHGAGNGHYGDGSLFDCLFGWAIPSGNCGQGLPLVGKYHMVYADRPDYVNPADTQLYGAGQYGMPITVPLAPTVNYQYNYSSGVPSSRITTIGTWNPQTSARPLNCQSW